MPPLLLLFFLTFSTLIADSQKDLIFRFCSGGFYSVGSPYDAALRRLVADIVAAAPNSTDLYSTLSTTVSNSSQKIFGYAQCRPDASDLACADCLREPASIAVNARSDCGRTVSLAIYQDLCLLRYAYKNVLGVLDEAVVGLAHSIQNASDAEDFGRRVADLMGKISWEAATAPARFAVGSAYAGTDRRQKIYGMGWCTRDLGGNDCFRCLQGSVGSLPLSTVGGRVFKISCLLRFEVYLFFDPSFNKSHPLPKPDFAYRDNSTDGGAGDGGDVRGRISTGTFLIVAISEGVALVLMGLTLLLFLLRRTENLLPIMSIKLNENEEEIRREKFLLLDFGIISAAANKFSEENKLGEGGFGPVYKGVLRDGHEIAVKRLSRSSGQGVIELKNEVAFVAKLQHRNLVRLLGCCLEKEEKLLVYEFLPNTSLDKHLFDPVRKIQLDWGTRYKIIEGISQGLLYLHEDSRLRVIHCDLKASNILLDGNMNPKISDFGLAKLFGMDEVQGNTSRIAGTYGYMAPEYALRGFFSDKTDVYSYGVLVLEIVTGRRNMFLDDSEDSVDLLRFVWQKWKEGQALEAVDQSLGDRFISQQALRCIQIGLLCTQEDPVHRPNMASLVVMLSSYSIVVQEPLMPDFLR